MEHQAVRSRDIAIIGYEPETSTLEIAFRTGSVYRYAGVPEDVHRAFMAASSYGLYFRDHIREKYKAEKIT